MNILVVGGAGYIGGAVAAALRAAGHDVLIYDSLVTGHRAAVPNGVPLIVGDIGDAAALDDLFRAHRIDLVMHFAALIETGESMRTPEKYFRNNVGGTRILLDAMARRRVDRLVYSSSAAVYGDPGEKPVGEDAAARPVNPYGESKLRVERALAEMRRTQGLRCAILRYFNAAGAAGPDRGEDHRPESHLIPLTLSVALGRRESISINGTDYPTPDGTCVRDYVHILDIVDAHLLMLDALRMRGQLVYNLGNGAGFTVRQVIEAARRVTGHPIPTVDGPRRPGDPAVLVAGAGKIHAELGWAPRRPRLETIVASAWEWHRRHPDGYG